MKTPHPSPTALRLPDHIRVTGKGLTEFSGVLTKEALEFVAKLEREFGTRRLELLKKRVDVQMEINAGRFPEFSPATKHIRQSYWRVAPTPADLLDRRVEITAPTDRKMMINALNSGAQVFMADFEDSNSPTWDNLVRGQVNVSDAVNRSIAFASPEGKNYTLHEQTARLMIRPRGWHMDEKHMIVDNHPVSGSLFDFGLFFYHNARTLLEEGSGPYLYLPKLESHLEARLWNDVFLMAQDELGIPYGSIRATVLIETLPAAFEMNEILYELKEHSAGLNCGRWDYIFSVIKKFHRHAEFLLPDRARLTMMARFLRSNSLLLIQTCHKRGTHAMGGMAAYIPVKNDPRANDEALSKVRADKEREVDDGHDGSWVAHPALVPVAQKVFDQRMTGPNQLHRKREDVQIDAEDLLSIPMGEISEQGIRTNISVALQYMESWLRGRGCVPIQNLMEDSATAEISRAQLWQWIQHGGSRTPDKRRVNEELFQTMVAEEMEILQSSPGFDDHRHRGLETAKALLHQLVLARNFPDYFTTLAYPFID